MHFVRRATRAPLCLLPFILGLAACAENRASLFVQQVNVPVAGGQGAGCTVVADPTNPFISRGTLDIALSGVYGANLLVANQLITVGNASRARAETDWVNLQGAEVRLEDARGVE